MFSTATATSCSRASRRGPAFHLSDSNLEAGRDEHRLPGKGRLPLKPFLAALGASGYPGAVSLELKPWPLGTPDPEIILERMKAARRFVRDGLEGR